MTDAVQALIFDALARGDACAALGDASSFLADGFSISSVTAPSFSDDGNGGHWSTTFTASVTGRTV